MIEEISKLSENSKVWVYQSNRILHKDEQNSITDIITTFCGSWQSHGKNVVANFLIEDDQFIVLIADEDASEVSGCSIDSSVAIIKQIDQTYKLGLLDRSLVTFQEQDQRLIIPFNTIRKEVENDKIKKDTLLYDNSISNLKEFNERWKVPAIDSWVGRHFK